MRFKTLHVYTRSTGVSSKSLSPPTASSGNRGQRLPGTAEGTWRKESESSQDASCWQCVLLRSPVTVKLRQAKTRIRIRSGRRARGSPLNLEWNEPAGISRHNGGTRFGRASFRFGIRRLLARRAHRLDLGRLHPSAAHPTVSRHYRS